MVSLKRKRNFNWLTIRQIVLYIWIFTFSHLIWNDNYTFFLKPSFGFLIYSGLTISVLFAIGNFFDPHDLPRSGGDILNALYILLPIIFIFSAGDQTLNSATLSKRTLVMPTSQIEEPLPPDPDVTDSMGEVKEPMETDGESIETSLSELLRNWNRFSGKNVSLEGLYANAVEDETPNPMVFKYLISCCVADALPVAIFLEDVNPDAFADDDWIRVTGVVNLKKRNGTQNAVYMTVRTIKKIPKPSKVAAYIFF